MVKIHMQSKMSSTGEKKPKTTKNRNIACLHLQFFLKLHLSSGFSFAIVLIFYLFFCIFWSNLVTPIIATVMMILIDYVSRGYAARLTKPDAVSLRLMMYYVSGASSSCSQLVSQLGDQWPSDCYCWFFHHPTVGGTRILSQTRF